MYSRSVNKTPPTPTDYPAGLDKAFIESLLTLNPKQPRHVPVKNIHESRPYAGIESDHFGLVSRHDYALAYGWLKQVSVEEEK